MKTYINRVPKTILKELKYTDYGDKFVITKKFPFPHKPPFILLIPKNTKKLAYECLCYNIIEAEHRSIMFVTNIRQIKLKTKDVGYPKLMKNENTIYCVKNYQ